MSQRNEKSKKMICPRCKQVFVRVAFGIACGCAVLSGDAEEPPHSRFPFNQVPQIEYAVSSSATAMPSRESFFTWPNKGGGGSG